jgi:hypothetical protein
MKQEWYIRLLWWACEKLGHFGKGGWVYNGYYHRDCRVCKRIVSEPLKNDDARGQE